MRDRVAGEVARDSRPVHLPAHDPEHQVGRGLVYQGAALHHLEQPPHLARRRQAEGMFALTVELFRGCGRAQSGKPCRGDVDGAGVLQSERLHPPVDGIRAADHPVQHLGGRIVRDDDHHRDQVLDRHRRARIQTLNRSGARLGIGRDEGVLVGELELPRLDLLQRFDHQRNLDRTHRLHLAVGLDRDLFAGFERLDEHSPGGVDAARGALDGTLKPRQRRWRSVLCADSGSAGGGADHEHREDRGADEDALHAVTPTFSMMLASTGCAWRPGRLLM